MFPSLFFPSGKVVYGGWEEFIFVAISIIGTIFALYVLHRAVTRWKNLVLGKINGFLMDRAVADIQREAVNAVIHATMTGTAVGLLFIPHSDFAVIMWIIVSLLNSFKSALVLRAIVKHDRRYAMTNMKRRESDFPPSL